MADLNWIDRAIGYFSPRAGLTRARARAAMSMLRSYDGASRGRRTAGWRAPSTSANAEAEGALVTLRDRSRDLVRNNPYANKGLQVIVSNTVGYGIMASFQGNNQRALSRVNKVWNEWAFSRDCDSLGCHDFAGLQALALRTVVESGECLIVRETSRSSRVPLQLRVLEPDHIDHGKNDTKTRQGIEYDDAGRPVAYWLFTSHPGDRYGYLGTIESKRIPADRVIHLYRMDRPGQRRGIPWVAPVMMRLRDLDDFEDAQLVRQKIAACYTAFVVEPDGESPATEAELLDKIEPGAIEILPPGRDIKLANPPGVDGYGEYVSQVLHAVACGYGISYESLTGDLTNTNFSSGRMGWIEMHRNIESWRWQFLIPRLLDQVWSWFVGAAGVVGDDFSNVAVEWTPPRREMIDPTKEVPALVAAIRSGLMTLSEVQRSFGFDPLKLMQEYADDMTRLDELGLVLDCDPRKTDQAGKRSAEDSDEELDAAIRSLTRDLAAA